MRMSLVNKKKNNTLSWVPIIIVIQVKRKFKRRRKQKRKRGNLRGGREAPPRRLLHPLRFCFRLRLNLRLI